MGITLAPEQERIVRRLVESGDFESEQEAVAEVFRLFEEYDADLLLPRDVVQAAVQVGVDQLDRGEGRPWDLQEFLGRARVRRAKKVHA